MKAAVVYYTFGGSTKKEAERIGAELGAPVYRVKEAHNRSFLGSFIPGGYVEKAQKNEIQPPAGSIFPASIKISSAPGLGGVSRAGVLTAMGRASSTRKRRGDIPLRRRKRPAESDGGRNALWKRRAASLRASTQPDRPRCPVK
jgi:hypothetical protein